MAKKKPATTEKSPQHPSARPDSQLGFETLLVGQPTAIQKVCLAARQLIQEVLPAADEGIYGGTKVGIALYSLEKKGNCGIQPSLEHCLLYLHYLQPSDSPNLKMQGKGKHAKHIKLTAFTQEIRVDLAKLIRMAVQRSSSN